MLKLINWDSQTRALTRPHPCGAEERLGSSVRMSMVPEVTVAKHCGLRVLGLTLVTNKVSLDYSREEKVNHDEVLEICKMRADRLLQDVELPEPDKQKFRNVS
uniref:purine-nucleoside phosphorylase n=1 Tax=Poecilia latipinna TaxID=48699 RepID=A0A3B3VFT2_9TELE